MGSCDFISSSDGAKICLEGIVFPASKEDILNRIEKSGGPEAVIVAANQLPEKVFSSFDDLVECLGAE